MVKLDWNELQGEVGSNVYIRPDTSTRLYTNGDDIAGTDNQLVDFQKSKSERVGESEERGVDARACLCLRAGVQLHLTPSYIAGSSNRLHLTE